MSEFKFDDIIVEDNNNKNNKKSKLTIILITISIIILAVIIYILYGIMNTKKEISNLAQNEQSLIESNILSEDETFIPEDTTKDSSDAIDTTKDSIIIETAKTDTTLVDNKNDSTPTQKQNMHQQNIEQKPNYQYFILVNSFRGFYYVKKQINLLKSYGYNSFYKKINVKKGKNKGKWYKVYAGPFNNLNDARKASKYIKNKQKQKNIFIIKKKV